MTSPLSIRLDDRLRDDLEREASARGVPLSRLVRELLEEGVSLARRERIRADGARVAAYAAAAPEARALFDGASGGQGHGE
ncbi:hypothetical protein [Komagataeibacter sp. FNDCR2]|uniref:hypothetical protein n=1 Tax=Komagataeibacter sp. FNDCR2 TaxID=2878682 RepID=UPI001E60CDA4|nr:hypothetical protein [Komagataeibacter sp. FNDCR2]MCE2576753.1 hypothetical protein [Komagataeibacter sp. FNDCR2]